MLEKHIESFRNSQYDCKIGFNAYMQKFLTLNRELRTSNNGITELLDNVPSVFALPEKNNEGYYEFTVHKDLNTRGTIKILFESKKPVRVFVSDSVKKPSA